MKKLLWSVPLALLLSSTQLMGAAIVLGKNQVSPVDAPYVSTEVLTPAGYDGSKLHDLDSGTFASIRDDTLTGDNVPDTTPDFAEAPTTGHVVLDLGEVMAIDSVTLYSVTYDSGHGYGHLPMAIDFFYYSDDDPSDNAIIDDIDGDTDINFILTATVGDKVGGATWSTTFPSTVTARYIGMRLNGSYSDGHSSSYNSQIADVVFTKTVDVPEPSSVALLLTSILGLAVLRRRKK